MDYLGGTDIITRVLKCGRGKQNCQCERVMSLLALQQWKGKGHDPGHVGGVWKVEKSRKIILP